MKLLTLVLLGCLLSIQCCAFDYPDLDWQATRDKQPVGLSISISLPKTRYHVGEVITAEVQFTNVSQEKYHLSTRTGDRSGRIEDILFLALGPDDKPVEDPWSRRVGMGGISGIENLGTWSLELPVNQYLWLDRPGTYQVFAWSTRVRMDKYGTGRNTVRGFSDLIQLVSDPVTIVLDPLVPALEAEIIAQAEAELAGKDDKLKRAAAERLCYLRTSASRQALVPHIGKPYAFAAYHALESAPDPAVEAARILQAVKEGVLVADGYVLSFYARLKEPREIVERRHPWDYVEPAEPADTTAAQKEFAKRQKAVVSRRKLAMDELTTAPQTARALDPASQYEVMLGNLHRQPDEREKYRAELVKVQHNLTPKQAERVLSGWDNWGGDDLLPLAEKMVAAPHHKNQALRVLAKARPELARKIILEDLQRGRPLFNQQSILSLPAGEIPEFQPFFAAELTKAEPLYLDRVLAAVNHYGSAELLPLVIQVYTPKEGTWACSIAEASLQFWIRHAPAEGLAALERAVTLREKTRCYTSVLDRVLLEQWTPAALPLLMRALRDDEPEVVGSAIKILERHAGQDLLEPCIAALEALRARLVPEKSKSVRYLNYAANNLLNSNRWQLDPSQQLRLETLQSPK